MNDKNSLFLTHVAHHHSSAVVKNARTLCRKFAMMHEILPVLNEKPNGKRTLKYFSNLYNECVPIVVSITLYAVQNKLSERKKVYDSLNRAQNILGYMKVLDFRYKSISSSPKSTKKPVTWYNNSELENSEIIEKIKELFEL